MSLYVTKHRGRLLAPVYLDYGTQNVRLLYVDVDAANPGPIFIAGDMVGETPAQTFAREKAEGPFKLDEVADGHVRAYLDGDRGHRYVGMWCPYSKTVERAGAVLGEERTAHYARNGRAWCPAVAEEVETQ